jgi:hypothetical protein
MLLFQSNARSWRCILHENILNFESIGLELEENIHSWLSRAVLQAVFRLPRTNSSLLLHYLLHRILYNDKYILCLLFHCPNALFMLHSSQAVPV